jgi:hypothetical protein
VLPWVGPNISWALVAVSAVMMAFSIAMLALTAFKDPGFVPRSPPNEDVEYGCALQMSAAAATTRCGGVSAPHARAPPALGTPLPPSLALRLPTCLPSLPFPPRVPPQSQDAAGHQGPPDQRLHGDHQVLPHVQVRDKAVRGLPAGGLPTAGLVAAGHPTGTGQPSHLFVNLLCLLTANCAVTERAGALRVWGPPRRSPTAATTARRAAPTAPCATTAWTSLTTTAPGWAPASAG